MANFQPFWDDAYTVANPGPYLGALYAANAWDTAKVNGAQVPGLVTCSVARSRHLWVRSVPGIAPSVTAVGYEALHFTMSVKIWTPAQWQKMQAIMSFLQPLTLTKTKRGNLALIPDKAVAFDVFHPNLAAQSVTSAICLKLGPLTGDQVKTLSIEFLEYTSRSQSVQTPTASQPIESQYDPNVPAPSVAAQSGAVTPVNSTHGPQQKPSQAPTLTPTP